MRSRIAVGTSAALTATVVAIAIAPASASASEHLSIGPLRVGTKSAPLVIAASAGGDAVLHLSVNGHRVRDPFEFAGGHLQLAHLSASDGLVPGSNRLRVRARAGSGTATATRRIRIRRPQLLAEAGPDSGPMVGEVSRMGVEPAGPAAVRGLHRTWRLVERPDGADATLRHRHRPRSLLQTGTPGTYVLQLAARRSGSNHVSYDKATVSVSSDDPPIGVPVNTLGPNGEITVGSHSYGGGTDAQTLAYAVLERTTLAPVESGNVSYDNEGIGKLGGIADKYSVGSSDPKKLMIVSGRSSSRSYPDALIPFLKKLGVPVLDGEQVDALTGREPFSVIGMPGAAAGAATYRIPLRAGVSQSGAITGYFEKNEAVELASTQVYDYVSSNRPTYDTRAVESDTKNVMTVGGNRYETSLSSSGIAGASAGFHVLILDSQTLAVRENSILVTNSTDSGRDRALQAAVAGFLRDKFEHDGQPTVLLQTIGQPKAAGPEWQGIVDALSRLGANRLYVNALDGTTQYSIVGRVDSGQPPAESSTAYDKGPYPAPNPPPARLTGILTRDRASDFVPTVTATPTPNVEQNGGLNSELVKIAYQPLQDWPQLAPGAPRDQAAAAEHYICKGLNFCKDTATSCPTVRDCYWQNYTSDWHQKSNDLANLIHYPGGDPGFSEDTFNRVKAQLGKEISAVAQVKEYLHNLEAPFVAPSTGDVPVNLKQIAQNVWDSVQKPAGKGSAWGLGFGSSIAGVFALATGPIGAMGAGIAAVLSFASYFGDDGGQPILGEDITAKADELGKQFLDRIKLARLEIDGLGQLIVSDHGKLMAAFDHVDDDWKLPTEAKYQEVFNKLISAAGQWSYEALVPVAYPYLIRGNATNARQLNGCWSNQRDDAQMLATSGYDNNGNPIRSIYFFAKGYGPGSSPPSGFGDKIFSPDSGAGIEKLSFFTPWVFNGQIVHAVSGHESCDVGGQLPYVP